MAREKPPGERDGGKRWKRERSYRTEYKPTTDRKSTAGVRKRKACGQRRLSGARPAPTRSKVVARRSKNSRIELFPPSTWDSFFKLLHERFPSMPWEDQRASTNWTLDNHFPERVGHDTTKPEALRVYKTVFSYARHRCTAYDLNRKEINPFWPNWKHKRFVEPDIHRVMEHWKSLSPLILRRKGVMTRSKASALDEVPAWESFMSSNIVPALVHWLQSQKMMWPEAVEDVSAEACIMSPVLSAWMRSQEGNGTQALGLAASEMVNLVPSLVSWLLTDATTGTLAEQFDAGGRCWEVSTDDGFEEAYEVKQGSAAGQGGTGSPGLTLPTAVECQQLVSGLAEAFMRASRQQLTGTSLSMLCFAVLGVGRGHLVGHAA